MMSSSCCGNCGCDPCLCENPFQPDVDNLKEGTPVIQITGTPETSCTDPSSLCEMGPECEELIITDLTLDAAAGSTYTVTVCDALIYIPGTCVVIHGTATTSSSKQAVLSIESVDGPNRQVVLRQYPNEHDNAGVTLSGTLYLCPNALCPTETTIPDCPSTHEFFAVTDSNFTVPVSSPITSSAEFTLTECSDLKIGDRIKIDNAGCYDVSTVADNGKTLTVTNPGLVSNAASGTILSAGNRVAISIVCQSWIVEEGEETPFPDQLPPNIWVSSKYESCATTIATNAYYANLDDSILDHTLATQGTAGVLLKIPVEVDDLFLVRADVSILSPSVEIDIVVNAVSSMSDHPGQPATAPLHPASTEYCWLNLGRVTLSDGDVGGTHADHYSCLHASITKMLKITAVDTSEGGDPYAYLTVMYSPFIRINTGPEVGSCNNNWYGAPWDRYMMAQKINNWTEHDVDDLGHGLSDCPV